MFSQNEITKCMFFITFTFCLVLAILTEARCEISANQIGQTCIDTLKEEAAFLYLDRINPIQSDGFKKDLILLTGSLAGSGDTSLIVLLRTPSACSIVLSTEGRGISVGKINTKGYPNIITYHSEGIDEKNGALLTEDVTYSWNGIEYKEKVEAQTKTWGHLEIKPHSMSWSVSKAGGKIIAINKATKQQITVFEDQKDKDDPGSVTYDIVSLVGPVLSVFRSYYSDSGMHPSYGGVFKVANLDNNGKEISITELFDEAAVFKALSKDKIVKKSLGNNRPAQSIEQLIQVADGGCDVSFFDFPHSFAFHHVKGNEVAVRIGLPHGCEAMRGKFTQLGIYLPIPVAISDLFQIADKNKTLMRDQWHFK